jgi:streptomycin 6-kinase
MKNEALNLLIKYTQLWSLIPDGASFYSHSSLLQPVRFEGIPAMLKIPVKSEEKRGSLLMTWWDGYGAANVLNYDEQVLLLERISSDLPSLADMAKNGQDDEASCIICSVAAKLHLPRKQPRPELIHLTEWFGDLWPAAKKYGQVFH